MSYKIPVIVFIASAVRLQFNRTRKKGRRSYGAHRSGRTRRQHPLSSRLLFKRSISHLRELFKASSAIAKASASTSYVVHCLIEFLRNFCRCFLSSRIPCKHTFSKQNGMRLPALMEEVDPEYTLHSDTEEVIFHV